MHLLLITNVFPNPYQPTKGTFNLEMARVLAKKHEVRVVSPIAWVDEWTGRRQSPEVSLSPGRWARLDGVPVHYPRYYYPPKILRGQYGWFLWHSVRGTVCQLLEASRPDVVLGYWAHPDGEVTVRVARRAGVPGVVMVGGSDVLLLTQQAGRRRRILKVLRTADAVVTVSGDLKTKLRELGVNSDKIHVVYRGVDRELFSPGDRVEARRQLGLAAEAKVLLWVGRMVPVKGLGVLLEACAALRKRGVVFQLYLVGDGPLRRQLEEESLARGLCKDVSFVGTLPQDRLPDWYRAADVTVLPSRSEGVPNVLRESLACGTPFVASGVGGIPELAEGTANRLVPPGDPNSLAKAISQALTEPAVGAGRPATLANWAESAEALLNILQRLVSARSKPSHVSLGETACIR